MVVVVAAHVCVAVITKAARRAVVVGLWCVRSTQTQPIVNPI
jgi:hypothetical protein